VPDLFDARRDRRDPPDDGLLKIVESGGDAPGLVNHFFRHESGRLIARLVRRYGGTRITAIEDAVQSALARGLANWVRAGIPDNPAAWLTRVAENELRDQLRREATRDGAELETSEEVPPPPATFADEIDDDELRMLFVCCDDQLSTQAQLVLALKLLCGFSTKEIAARLFLSDANVQKILTRGRHRLAELWTAAPSTGVPEPSKAQLALRLPSVQRVIYLLFNEGYSSQRDDEVIRRDLCEEALRLGQLLVSHPAGDASESWALLALLYFHTARLDARIDEHGALLSLDEQDRSRWDGRRIRAGFECLWRSRGEHFSRYHAEAAVLAEHCMARSFEETRWWEIVDLYEMLESFEPSPLHTLNRAIALAEWKGPEAGLRLLQEMAPPAWLVSYYVWDAAFGELYRRAGDFARAVHHLERAIELAPTEAERTLLRRRLARCHAGDSNPRS
jgi:RNA polymerase sigma factor (sigma-70 family)